ncbi:hypothetical protein CHELA20_51243 [Hyphomicrobiales bacterium]|nr:hypothetical protein CHELA41_23768 [Hyphomicrobiales bacterium]CAH1674691.1 hypothetical protein CHELA20_51243 [Hyphomicrobiales bacterium]
MAQLVAVDLVRRLREYVSWSGAFKPGALSPADHVIVRSLRFAFQNHSIATWPRPGPSFRVFRPHGPPEEPRDYRRR